MMLPERKKVEKPHIVILGAGFGGVYTYRRLMKLLGDRVRFTIVSPDNYFLFTPLLHEVATGSLEANHIVEPLRLITEYSCTKIIPAKAESIDIKDRSINIPSGKINFDYLVCATGAKTNFYNVLGAEQNSFVLKSLADAVKLREHFITMFEEASHSTHKQTKEALLTFVIVGGGPTGVELATEISDLCYDTFLEYYHGQLLHNDIEIILVSSSPDVVPQFHEKVREKTKQGLHRKGVRILLSSSVGKVDEHGVVLVDGSHIESRTVIWTAGVCPNTPVFEGDIKPEIVGGRVVVGEKLSIKEDENIFFIGDVACALNSDGKPLPMLAQVAVQQATYVGDAIYKSILGKDSENIFKYKNKGELLSLGEWHAAGRVYGVTIWGPIAWFMWRTIYLFKFISKSKRLKIALDWTVNIFVPRDITKISMHKHHEG